MLLDDFVGSKRLAASDFIGDGGMGVSNGLAEMNQLPPDFATARRPFICPRTGKPSVLINVKQRDGRPAYTVNKGVKTPIRRSMPVMDLLNSGHTRVPIWVLNAATLRPEQWAEIDKKVILASRQPLVAYEDMRSANSYGGFDAYGRMYLEYQAMSDPGEAVEDFDLMTAGRHDQPLFLNRATPLPCTHADFFFSDRFMTISGNDSEPIDSLTGEAMSQRVSERIEDVTIGQVTGATYGTQTAGSHTHQGTATVYGMANFTYRTNKTNLTTPTGANPQSTVTDVLAMIQTLQNNAFYGPFTLYCSLSWNQFLGSPYAYTNGSNWAVNPSITLKMALEQLEGIAAVKTLPRWSAPILSGGSAGTYAMILIDWKKAGRAIDGRQPTVLQWDSMGGMRHNFKVWAIQVPQMFAEYSTNCALVYATTS